jgi:phosphatidylglycerophosphate synthase
LSAGIDAPSPAWPHSERSWSAYHAAIQLLATVAAIAIGRAAPVAWAALLSLGAWVWFSRGAFATLRDFGAANTVTSARVLSLAALAIAIDTRAAIGCALCSLGIFALDGVDGWLARRDDRASSFGAHYDMETDASFLLVLSVGLFEWHLAGAWVLFAGTLRYSYVLTLFLARRAHREAPRSRLGRYVFGLVVTAFTLAFWPAQAISQPLTAAATSLLTYSFARSFYWSLRGTQRTTLK